MKRIKKGRALFYTRDSGGKHENTPSEYVAWAQREANRLGLSFNGTPESIESMIRAGTSASGDIFVDYGVQGHILSRKGLDVMIEEALRDPKISHIFIPRRDRLARPNNPIDGIKLENRLRENGLTLVFMDRVCPPLPKGKRQDISELIMATLEYDRSGQDRRNLAQKIIYAQIRLAKMGFSTGGRHPYGRRCTLSGCQALSDGQRCPASRQWRLARVRDCEHRTKPIAGGHVLVRRAVHGRSTALYARRSARVG